jgi:hypothetical protein
MAEALRDWLPQVIQRLEVFVSTDIIAGKRWSTEIGARLQETRFGVICVTPENQGEPWLNFEAGACSKHMQDAHVCPYVLDGTPADYKGPLTQFQMVGSDRQGTQQLIGSLNHAESAGLDVRRLESQFERCWPELEQKLVGIRAEHGGPPPEEKRNADDMIRELLELARARSSAPSVPSLPSLPAGGASTFSMFEAIILRTLRNAGIPITQARVRDLGNQQYRVKLYTTQGTKIVALPAATFATPDQLIPPLLALFP